MYKIPVSVLVILHDGQGQVLLLKRTDGENLWQSVTGSLEVGETLEQTACREVREETGVIVEASQLVNWHEFVDYEIYPRWRHRYESGVTHNREHIFSLQIQYDSKIILSEREHSEYIWLSQYEASQKVFSPSNAQAITCLYLPHPSDNTKS